MRGARSWTSTCFSTRHSPVAFIGFTEAVGGLVTKLVPDTKDRVPQTEPRYLDAAAISTPALALANAARETLRIGDTVEQMLNGMLQVIRTNDLVLADEVIKLDDDVDRLYTAVKLYLTQITKEMLDEKDSRRWAEIISLTINLEHVGDILERIMQDLRDKKIAHRLSFSEAGMGEIEKLHAKLIVNLRLGMSVFLNGDLKSAQDLLVEKERFRDLERRFHDSHLDRLAGQTVQSIETSSLHLDIISDMRRINSFFCSTAYPDPREGGTAAQEPPEGCDRHLPGAARPRHHEVTPWVWHSATSRSSSATTAISSTAARA
jgi:phosphate:Na+ symporter